MCRPPPGLGPHLFVGARRGPPRHAMQIEQLKGPREAMEYAVIARKAMAIPESVASTPKALHERLASICHDAASDEQTLLNYLYVLQGSLEHPGHDHLIASVVDQIGAIPRPEESGSSERLIKVLLDLISAAARTNRASLLEKLLESGAQEVTFGVMFTSEAASDGHSALSRFLEVAEASSSTDALRVLLRRATLEDDSQECVLQHLHEHIKIEASHGPVEARRTAKQRIAMLVDAGALRLPLLLDDPVLGTDQVCQQILRGDTKALNALLAFGVRTDVRSSADQLPIEVCKQRGDDMGKMCAQLLEDDRAERPASVATKETALLSVLANSQRRMPTEECMRSFEGVVIGAANLSAAVQHKLTMNLIMALRTDNKPLVKCFLDAGTLTVISYVRDHSQTTGNHHATMLYLHAIEFADHGHVECLRSLIRAEIVPDRELLSKTRNRPLLEMAMDKPHIDSRVIFALVEAGEDPLELYQGFGNVLHWACMMGRKDVVDFMVPRVPTLDTPRLHDHRTPLTIAANMGYCSIVDALLDAGASIDFHAEGKTALATTFLTKFWDQIDTFVKSPKDKLIEREKENREATRDTLIQHGADLMTQDRTGRTILDYLTMTGKREQAEALRRKAALREKHLARKTRVGAAEVDETPVVTEEDSKQAEDAAQALLAEEDAKPSPAKGGGTAAKTNKKKSKQKKKDEKKRAPESVTDAPAPPQPPPPPPPSRGGIRAMVGSAVQRLTGRVVGADDERGSALDDSADDEMEGFDECGDETKSYLEAAAVEEVEGLDDTDEYDDRPIIDGRTISRIDDGVIHIMKKLRAMRISEVLDRDIRALQIKLKDDTADIDRKKAVMEMLSQLLKDYQLVNEDLGLPERCPPPSETAYDDSDPPLVRLCAMMDFEVGSWAGGEEGCCVLDSSYFLHRLRRTSCRKKEEGNGILRSSSFLRRGAAAIHGLSALALRRR